MLSKFVKYSYFVNFVLTYYLHLQKKEYFIHFIHKKEDSTIIMNIIFVVLVLVVLV